MKSSKLSRLFLLAITMVLTFGNTAKAQKLDENADVVLKTIATRVSVRSYLDKPVEKEQIERLLRAGMAAPTAMNRQPWHFVVLTDKGRLEELSQTNPHSDMLAKAPLAIVVCGDMKKAIEGKAREFWVQDCSAATENILLAAHAMGLGAVWTGAYPSEERCKAIADVLQLPEHIIPLNIIIIGYPDKENSPKDKWNPDNISFEVFGGK